MVTPLASSSIILVGMLANGQFIEGQLGISEYVLFTVIGTLITGFVVLRDQDIVTDRVLWGGRWLFSYYW